MNRPIASHHIPNLMGVAAAVIAFALAAGATAQAPPSEIKPDLSAAAGGQGLSSTDADAPPSSPSLTPPSPTASFPAAPEPDVGIPPNSFGHLGVTVEPLADGDGLRVVGIETTSPAWPAGLLINDEITTINGKRITRFSDLVAGLRAAADGDGNVSLLVRRRGTVDTINLFVGGKKAETERPKFGVTLDDSNGRLRVTGVTPNSPAAKGGVQVGDEIVTVNDYPVSTFDLFVGQIQALGRAGGPVSLGVRRHGQMQTLHATISPEKTAPALPKSELPSGGPNPNGEPK